MSTPEAIERLFREEHGRVLATLIRHCGGDFALAEDALQDALAEALGAWPRAGVPERPAAWITTTARRRAIDRLRRERGLRERLPALARLAPDDEPRGDPDMVADDRLRLIFTCCHPALALEARVALTLRTLGGLSTPEIARAFLTSEPAMQQRLVRAKRKIAAAGIPYAVPRDADLPARTAGVLAVLYLVFNEGYVAAAGDRLIREDLCVEAIRLARIVASLHARRRRGRGAAGADAAARRSSRGAHGTRRPAPGAARAGPRALRPRPPRRGPRRARPRAAPRPPRPLPAAGRHRRAAHRGPGGLAAGGRALRVARAAGPVAGGGRQPRRGRRHGRATRAPGSRSSTRRRASTPTSRCTPPAPSSCAARASTPGADAA